MTALFLHLFFAPWRRFRNAVTRMENDQAATELGRIRWLVATNLALGIVVVLVATGGRYWPF